MIFPHNKNNAKNNAKNSNYAPDCKQIWSLLMTSLQVFHFRYSHSQCSVSIGPCTPVVCDAGQKLKQHWLNVSCLLRRVCLLCALRMRGTVFTFLFRALEYFYINHENQRFLFQFEIFIHMSELAFPPSFEYLCYRSTAIINRPRLILVPSLRGSSEVDL